MADLHSRLRSTITERLETARAWQWEITRLQSRGDQLASHLLKAFDADAGISLYEGLLRIVDEHAPVLEHVEWPHDTTGHGQAHVCPSCRPADPTDWHPAIGEAGTLPDGFVPSYVLAPCPTLSILSDSLGVDTGGTDG